MPPTPVYNTDTKQYSFDGSVWQLNSQSLIDPASLTRSLTLNNQHHLIPEFHGRANSFHMRTGRTPSSGYVLATGAVLNSIFTDTAVTSRTLLVGSSYSDSAYQLTISNLFILSATALTPGITVPADPEVPPTDLTPDTVYLVQLVDRRHFAPWTTLDNHFTNWRDADYLEHSSLYATTYAGLLASIWAVGLSDLLGDLTIVGSPGVYTSPGDGQTEPATTTLKPDQYRFTNESAWEAFLSVADDCGCLLAPKPDHTGFTLYAADSQHTLSDSDQTSFDARKRDCLTDSEGTLIGPTLPTSVSVSYHVTGSQYYTDPDAQHETPQDQYRDFPHQTEVFQTIDLLSPLLTPAQVTALTSNLIPGTTLPLWAPHLVQRDENDALLEFDENSLTASLKALATSHLHTKYQTGQSQSWTFSGFWSWEIGTLFAQASFYDYGQGFFSYYTARQVSPPSPQREYPGKPDIHRQTTPYTRIAYGRVENANANAPGYGAEVTEDPKELLDIGQSGKLTILYTRNNRWYSAGFTVDLYPYGNTPLQVGRFIHAHYNYQAGQHGRWYPFLGSGGAFTIGKVVQSTIAVNSLGYVEIYNELWEATGQTVEVLNPHEVELPVDLRVRWGPYPGWTHLVVEPFDYTQC